jgi:serine protease Do
MNKRAYPTFSYALLALSVLATVAPRAWSQSPIDAAVQSVQEIEASRIAAIDRAIRPTVAVFGNGGEGGGSGVVISPDGYALTNFHVTSPFGTNMRCGMSDGKIYPAVIVGIDATGDLALIKLLGRSDFPTATLGDSRKLQVGQWCFAVGNPFLLATNLQPSVSYGIISGIERYQYPAGTILEYADCIQTDAAINPGNSGGPLFNRNGELIGINGRASFEKRGRVNVGVGYAISINQVKNFVGTLRGGRYVDHATLGATVSTDDNGRVRVSNILNSSDAYRRGLRYGDEIVELAGRSIRTTNELKNVLGTLPNDWRVKLKFRGSDGERETLVRLAAVHTPEELFELVQGGLPGMGPEPKEPEEAPEETPKKGDSEPNEKSDTPAEAEQPSPAKPQPAEWKAWHLEKSGYANFFFNQYETRRVLSLYRQSLGELPANHAWKFSGKWVGDERPVEFNLDQNKFAMVRGGLIQAVDPKQGFSRVVAKRNLDGLSLVLGLWRELMLGTGNAKNNLLDNAIYLGTMPLLGNFPLHDVLEVQISDARMRMYFHPDTNTLAAAELYGDEGDDPIEVYFDKPQEFNGRSLPSRLRLQYGVEPFAVFIVEQVDLAAPLATEVPAAESGS